MKLFVYFLAMTGIVSSVSSAQAINARPCCALEFSQFDFWLGNWELTYNDTVHATNTITKELEGCVVHEHFNDPSSSFRGESWSVYNPAQKKWQQTWVDNQGGYIKLTGEFKDGKMALFTQANPMPDGSTKISRMVYYNIGPDSLDWDWEASVDNGKTWKTNWRIHYKRSNR